MAVPLNTTGRPDSRHVEVAVEAADAIADPTVEAAVGIVGAGVEMTVEQAAGTTRIVHQRRPDHAPADVRPDATAERAAGRPAARPHTEGPEQPRQTWQRERQSLRLRLSVHAATGRGAATTDVVVTARPSDTPLSAVAGPLRTASGTLGSRFYAGDVPLDESAVLGVPPLVDGTVLSVDAPGVPGLPTGVLQLHVTGGPDSGGVHLLHVGTARIGRASDAEIQLDDPDVSRHHAVLEIIGRQVTVADLGSTNGTVLDGTPVGPEPVPLRPGALLRIGESSLVLTAASDGTGSGQPEDDAAGPDQESVPGLPVRPDGMGRLEVTRAPRPLARVALPAPRFVLPDEPVVSRRTMPGARRRLVAAYDEERAAVEAQAQEAVLAEARLRRQWHPDPASLLVTALGRGAGLWERRRGDDDALLLRTGTANLPSEVSVASPDGRTRTLLAPAVPVPVSLRNAGVIGLAGPRTRVTKLARALVAQVAGLHSPQDLGMVLLCGDDDPAAAGAAGPGGAAAGALPAAQEWAWMRWLPHLTPVDGQDCGLLIGLSPEQVAARLTELLAELDARQQAGPAAATNRCLVTILDRVERLAFLPQVERLLVEGPSVGMYSLCLAEHGARALPRTCRTVLEVTGEVHTRLRVAPVGMATVDQVVADAVSPAWAERFARALAPLREATPGHRRVSLPDEVRLLALLDLDLLTPAKVTAAWQRSTGSTEMALGAFARNVCTVSLDSGPLLVGGAPGTGTSEVLRSALAALALGNRPDQVAFVLVAEDAAAFGECAALPHAIRALTGPDEQQSADLLSVLEAELDHRASLLAGAAGSGPKPFGAVAGSGVPLPRLVVAVDDLAELADRLPRLVKGLATVADRGRALGVHLIMATDQPEETACLDLTEAAELRIVLRTLDAVSSQVLIGTEDAVSIAGDLPGRGLLRRPDGGIVPFQAARISGRMPIRTTTRPTVVRQQWADLGAPVRRATRSAAGPTDLALLVETVRKAAEQLGVEAAALPG